MTPDIGALTRIQIAKGGKSIDFVNAFAANDKESIPLLWRLLGLHERGAAEAGILINNRSDRMRRARDIAEIIAKEMIADWYIVCGDQSAVFIDMAAREGVPRQRLINLGGKRPAEVIEKMFDLTRVSSTVMAIGNIGGFGMKVLEAVKEMSSASTKSSD